MKKSIATLTVACGLLAASPAGATELVQNGNFDTGDFTGWTLVGDTASGDFIAGVAGDPANPANNIAYFNATTIGSVVQYLSTTPGQSYNWSFDLELTDSDGTPTNNFYFTFGDDFYEVMPGMTSLDWTTFSGVTGPATGSSTPIQFYFHTDNDYYLLDNVSFSAVGGVPEPSTWAMMILGFAAVGGSLRMTRRKRNVAVARA